MSTQTKKKVLVTGGAGFIGSNLTDRLISEGYAVTILDNLSFGKKENINKKAKFVNVDIKNLDNIQPHFKGIDAVFHCAARARIQPSIIDPIPSFEDNIVGTLNVLVASRNAGVRRVVYSASSSAYGDQKTFPLKEHLVISEFKNPYALTKHVGENMCRLFSTLYGLETVCLRYFNVYGPRQTTEGAYATVIGIFLRQLREGKPVTIVSPGTIRRDFTFVKDVVDANVRAMKSKKVGKGETINVGTGNNYSINEVAALMIAMHKAQEANRPFQAGFAIANIFPTGGGSVLGEEKPKAFLASVENAPHATYIPMRPGEAKVTLAGNKKARQLLGWKPTVSFVDGLGQFFQ